jgi:hypothetical protein
MARTKKTKATTSDPNDPSQPPLQQIEDQNDDSDTDENEQSDRAGTEQEVIRLLKRQLDLQSKELALLRRRNQQQDADMNSMIS